jgi:hypothetical protein
VVENATDDGGARTGSALLRGSRATESENEARRHCGLLHNSGAPAAMPHGEIEHAIKERRKPIFGRCPIPDFQ